jgi:dinuclear metal center YbgI/SA1388 family protein
MVKREKIVKFLNKYLEIDLIKDRSMNGLQVEGKDNIEKIALGVSANEQLFIKAVDAKADMLIVHHGMFWGESFPIKGFARERLWTLLKSNMNLLAYHLPLDKHPVVGNNAQLIKLFDVKHSEPFANYKGTTIGYKAELKKPLKIEHIIALLKKHLGSQPISHSFGKKNISKIGVVSGGAADMMYQGIDEDLDLFITGETSEFVQELARETKMNFIAAGHYNTETLGVMALSKLLKDQFDVKTQFIDVPNSI